MRTDYVAQAIDIKYRVQTERNELTQIGLRQVSLLTHSGETPSIDVGILSSGADEWEVGKEYQRGDLFQYEGNLGFVRQAHTSQAQ